MQHLMNDMAKVAGGAFQSVMSMKDHLESMVEQLTQQWLQKQDLINREEFEALKEMIIAIKEEQASLSKKLSALEKKLSKN